MNTLKPNTSTLRIPFSILGILVLVLGLFLVPSLTGQETAALHTVQALQKAGYSGTLPVSSLSLSPVVLPVADTDTSKRRDRLETLPEWQNLTLARMDGRLPGGVIENLSSSAVQPSARVSKRAEGEAPQSVSNAILPTDLHLPGHSSITATLPEGTPFCYLPAARGLVCYPTPPPHAILA